MPRRLLCLLALPCCCAAAEPDSWITTDRPDFVDAPEVVGKGRVQLEAGFARVRDGGSTSSFDFGGGYSLARDLHVDAGVMLGLNRRTPGLAFTVGLSVRL